MAKAKNRYGQAKSRTYPCRLCGEQIPNTLFRCGSCGTWNVDTTNNGPFRDETILLKDVPDVEFPRLETGPWDICWGGGITRGTVTLLGGAPGAGKSTLSLKLAAIIAERTGRETLYVSAEERNVDIKARAKRTEVPLDGIRMFPLGTDMVLSDVIEHFKPSAAILDSLPGLVGEDLEAGVRLCTDLKQLAAQTDMPCIVIDHVTKELEFGGKMSLQHAVDTTLLFSVEEFEDGDLRLLKTIKNRHGASGTMCFFDMTEKGLVWIHPDDLPTEDEDDEEE